MAIAAKPEFYNVELEVSSKAGDGTMQYRYTAHANSVSEELANTVAAEMKAIGVGGRIVHLDGTPEGKVINAWGSIERTAAAETIEKAAIEK